MDPLGPGAPFLVAGDELFPPVPADVKSGLIPGQATGEGNHDNPGQVEVEFRGMRGETGQEQDGLTFEKGPDEQGEVPVVFDDMTAVLAQVRQELGPEAVILGNQTVRENGRALCEVMALKRPASPSVKMILKTIPRAIAFVTYGRKKTVWKKP